MAADTNLRRLHRPKKIIVIGQIIGSGKMDPFMLIESVIASISIFRCLNPDLDPIRLILVEKFP